MPRTLIPPLLLLLVSAIFSPASEEALRERFYKFSGTEISDGEEQTETAWMEAVLPWMFTEYQSTDKTQRTWVVDYLATSKGAVPGQIYLPEGERPGRRWNSTVC